MFVALVGPQSFYPLGWGSRKQTCASHSSVEAEVVALESAVRVEGIPSLDLWEKILGRTPEITLYEDNQAAATIVTTGKYPKLRHVSRLHGVNISCLHEENQRGLFKIVDCHTKRQAADIFTKPYTSADEWQHYMRLVGVISDPALLEKVKASFVGGRRGDIRSCAGP